MTYKLFSRPGIRIMAVLVVCLVVLATVLLAFDKPRTYFALCWERPRIEQALKIYFAAEMAKDYDKVYQCLAPSSPYRQTHSYQDFIKDMQTSPVKIVDYKLVDIYDLRPNYDRRRYPRVERLAQVEVDVTILFTDTRRKSSANYCFTFLKEGGAWFKG